MIKADMKTLKLTKEELTKLCFALLNDRLKRTKTGLKTFYTVKQKQIEGKIFDLQDKLEICEIALNEVNDCDELEPAYKDIIKAYREHISDLEEFLKLLPIQRVSGALPPALVLYRAANTMTFEDFAKWYNGKSDNDH